MEAMLLAAGTSATTAATVSTVLSTGFTVASAAGSILGGQQQNAVYKAQAKQSELSARQEELKGRAQADTIRRSLASTLASQNAAFAARGISLNSGTARNIANESKTQATYDIETTRFGSQMAAEAERGTAVQQRISGRAARTSGYVTAIGSLIR